MSMDAKEHYDHVTEAWKEFMGEHLHFGYFESEDVSLEQATELMTEKMLERSNITGESRVLDVGCGVGGPAFYIHEKYKCAIDGISTSERGVGMANDASREKGYDNVRFKVADAINNGYPDNTFDVVWFMESSHLMPDKKSVFKECARVLKDDGTLVLCDLIQLPVRSFLFGFWHFLLNYRDFIQNRKTWGPAQILPVGKYCDYFIAAGFHKITVLDVTREAMPTLRRWKENAQRFLDSDMDEFTKEDVRDFIRGCQSVQNTFDAKLCGYSIVQALK